MRVFWNKEFYEKYSSVFNIQVWAIKEIPDSNGYCYNYDYYSYDNTTTRSYIVLLDPSFGWSESDGKLTVLNWESGIYEHFPVNTVYMELPDELRDIFPDLEPWIDYSFSMTLSSTSDI